MALVLFLLFLLPVGPTVSIAYDFLYGDPTVSIAAAYNADIPDGWARYIFWQQPLDDEIAVHNRSQIPWALKTPVQITTAAKPKRASPLAALYRASNRYEGAHDVCRLLCYLSGIP